MSLDASLLSTMSPEEREAIEGADSAELESLHNVSGAVKDDIGSTASPKEEDEDEDEDEAPAADAAPVEGQGAAPASVADDAPPAAEASPEPAVLGGTNSEPPKIEPPQPPQEPLPVAFSYQLPADYEERVAAARTESDGLVDRFEAGELTREEFKAAQLKLADEQRQLDAMRIQADIATGMQQQAAEQRRAMAINRLFDSAAKPEDGGIDYRKDQGKFRDLDTFVKALAGDEANADRPLEWFLSEGHKRVKLLHGVAATPAPTPTPTPKPDAIKAAADARKPPIDAAPASLANIPGGTGPGDVGGEFADIMSLDGDDFEAAITRMAKTDPQRWQRFQSGNQ